MSSTDHPPPDGRTRIHSRRLTSVFYTTASFLCLLHYLPARPVLLMHSDTLVLPPVFPLNVVSTDSFPLPLAGANRCLIDAPSLKLSWFCTVPDLAGIFRDGLRAMEGTKGDRSQSSVARYCPGGVQEKPSHRAATGGFLCRALGWICY